MRPEHPNGGVQDTTQDLRDAGLIPTQMLAAKLGLAGCVFTVAFVAVELGVAPKLVTPSGGVYWAPEQLSDIAGAMINRLAKHLSMAGVPPIDTTILPDV